MGSRREYVLPVCFQLPLPFLLMPTRTYNHSLRYKQDFVTELEAAQTVAKAAGLGLWSGSGAVRQQRQAGEQFNVGEVRRIEVATNASVRDVCSTKSERNYYF